MNVIEISDSLTIFLIVLFVTFLVRYNWQRRWLYYYGWKLQGPLAFPLVGNALEFLGKTDLSHTLMEQCKKYPSVFRLWSGSLLMIINSKPEDLEILLSTHLEKGFFYDFAKPVLNNGLLTAPVSIWKRHRKLINPVFSTNILNSFMDIFNKRANKLVDKLNEHCGNGQFDVQWDICKCVLEISSETMTDSNPDTINGLEQYMKDVIYAEEIVTNRLCNALLHFDFIWKFSSHYKELKEPCSRMYDFCRKLIVQKIDESHHYHDGDIKTKHLITQLIQLNKNKKKFSEAEVLDELNILLIASSETSAVVQGLTLAIMAMYPEIQKNVYKEIDSIFGFSQRSVTLEDLTKMDYLERVIKETLRLFPPAPFILRQVSKDFKLHSYVYLKGTSIVVPIMHLHRDETIWKDPLKFDPDRFLPENAEKRHRCAFIPFSFGPRNCIGSRYAMMSMKVILSTILRNYRVVSSNYRNIEDVDIVMYAIIARPRDGVFVELERRD